MTQQLLWILLQISVLFYDRLLLDSTFDLRRTWGYSNEKTRDGSRVRSADDTRNNENHKDVEHAFKFGIIFQGLVGEYLSYIIL